ncbi:MAG: rhamnulokinase family protein [Planctomycetota bacterium]
MKLLAIDVGASSGRAIQAELDGGRLSMKEVHRFKNGMIEVDGHKHWDIDALRGELIAALTKADDDVVSLGIDTWGVDYGYVKDGEPMGLPFAYRDDRTQPMVDAVHHAVGKDWLFSVNGLQVMPFNTIYQVADDVMSRPEVMAEAGRMQLMPDLLGCLLTGEYSAEYSIASTSGLIDARTRDWSDELLDKLDAPRHLFGEISMPGGFSAPLKKEIADATGSGAKLVLAAGHDTADAVAATPMDDSSRAMYISSGTWSLAGVELDEPCITDAARDANFTNEGGVDNKIRFLKNVMGLWLVQELQRIWAEGGDELGFGEICGEAKKAPAFVSLVNPQNQRFMAPKNMEKEIQAECKRTGQPVPEGVGPLARCVFESLALAYRQCRETIQQVTGRKLGCVHIVGGGVQNKLLCQMSADACGVPVYAGPVEATAIGNLLVQAISLGAIADLHAAREVVKATFPLDEYAPQDQGAWQAAWERFQKLPAAG